MQDEQECPVHADEDAVRAEQGRIDRIQSTWESVLLWPTQIPTRGSPTESGLEGEGADEVRSQGDEHRDGNGDLEPHEPHRLAELGRGDQVISDDWVVA